MKFVLNFKLFGHAKNRWSFFFNIKQCGKTKRKMKMTLNFTKSWNNLLLTLLWLIFCGSLQNWVTEETLPIIQPPWASENIKHVNPWAILRTFQAEIRVYEAKRLLLVLLGILLQTFFLGIYKVSFGSKYEHKFSGIVVLRAARGLSYLI